MISTAKYPATVTKNDDPDKRGIIQVSCVELMGDEEGACLIDVEPAFDWGWFYVPDIGEIVEIEVIEGSSDDEQFGQTSIDGLDLKWRCVRYPGLEGDDPRPVNEDFTSKNYGKRRGFATPAGHVFMFDDTEGDESISLKWQNKDGENSFLNFDKDGSFLVSLKTGSLFYMNAKSGEVSIIDSNSNMISMDAKGLRLVDGTGNIFELKDGLVQILGQGTVAISCKNATIDAGEVEINGSSEKVILGTTFLGLYNAHVHPTGVGPSGPPFPQALDPVALSQTVTVG